MVNLIQSNVKFILSHFLFSQIPWIQNRLNCKSPTVNINSIESFASQCYRFSFSACNLYQTKDSNQHSRLSSDTLGNRKMWRKKMQFVFGIKWYRKTTKPLSLFMQIKNENAKMFSTIDEYILCLAVSNQRVEIVCCYQKRNSFIINKKYLPILYANAM